jgi:hypothetical protein
MASHKVKFKNILNFLLAYGRCDHQLSCDIIKTEFSDYDIKWSDEGY